MTWCEICGNDEEGTEVHSINPSCYLFPAVIRQLVKEGTAHNGRSNEECICVTVSSMFVTCWLVAVFGWAQWFMKTSLILLSSSGVGSSVSSVPMARQATLMSWSCSGGCCVPQGPLNGAGAEWARLGDRDRARARPGAPLQYSCLENHMDRGAWWTILNRVTKSYTRLKKSFDKSKEHIKKQRHYFANKGLSSQNYGFFK